jgi:hypothetical protein
MQLTWLCSNATLTNFLTKLCFPLEQEGKLCLPTRASSFQLQFWCKVHSLNLTHSSRYFIGWLQYVLCIIQWSWPLSYKT